MAPPALCAPLRPPAGPPAHSSRRPPDLRRPDPRRLALQDAWQLGPLLDGNELMALGVPKGRAVGAALAELIEWQLEHKEAGRDDARRFLQARLGERAP